MGNQLKHHQVFEGIQLWAGPIPSGYDVDFLGTHIRRYYDEDISPEHKNRPDQTTSAGLPPFDAEYFEWIDLLESVKNAKGKQYIFVELGAGYGRWSVRAAQAIRRLNPMPFKIIAVEGEPTHYEFLKQNFYDNEINPSDCELIKAAVWHKKGAIKFCIGNPKGWYGQYVVQSVFHKIKLFLFCRLGFYKSNDQSAISVPTITLRKILSTCPHIDMIDMDVQGSELVIISHAIQILNEKVMRIHIGTHSSEIEKALYDIFLENNWRNHFYYRLNSTAETPYGKITFDDGVQSWINPRLSTDI